MKSYSKKCPKCNKTQNYSSNSAFWLAKRNNSKCRNCSTTEYAKRKGDVSFLLDESLESYYWIGFILADGHISNGRLTIGLSNKDRDHLEKFANKSNIEVFTYKRSSGYSENSDFCKISIMNKGVLSVLTDKYSIYNNKTENPPVLTELYGDKLEALKIGFIDGDGNIKNLHNRKDFQISIQVHSNWINNLIYMFGSAYINKRGYAVTCISNTITCKELKKFAIKNNLPVMKRKWDKVDLNFIGKQELAKERVKIVRRMLLENKTMREILDKTGLKESGFYRIKRLNNL